MVKIYFKKFDNISKESLRFKHLRAKHYRTYNNSILIFPIFLYKNIEVYNGKKYIPINITKKKIGYYFRNFMFNNNLPLKINKEFNVKIIK